MDAHLTLGNWLLKLRRPDEAIAAFKQALALKPDDDIALGNLARRADRRAGRTQDALDGARGLPDRARASTRRTRSRGSSSRRSTSTWVASTRRAAASRRRSRPTRRWAAALNGLGAIAFQTGDLAKAETMVRQALELEPRLRTGHYNLARIREARGDVAGAEALYREELATYADNGRARFNLAQLRRARGDREGYLSELNDCVAKAPEFGACYFYLAREELDAGRLDPAADLAKRGLEAQPRSDDGAARPLRAGRRLQPTRPGAAGRGGSREGPQARGGAAQEPGAAHLSPLPAREQLTSASGSRRCGRRSCGRSRISPIVIALSAAFTMS